ncbi:MAG TPA: universal stress protein [Burkholderiaceae bacterium]|jgi:nucleotide-binding universal stress UspA family protein|nr:universal stress protein [Burkholderiaceae bacterium]
MSSFASLLLPHDGSPEAAKGVGCALWLAEALGATLHVLHAAAQPVSAHEELARFDVPSAHRPQVILHQLAGNADDTVLEAISSYQVDLVVMSARGESASAGLKLWQRLGTVARAVIERSPVPVLLLPIRYREVLPWTSMLAAASGEMAADRALEAATQLAAALRIKVTVVHAEDSMDVTGAAMPLDAYTDAAHHEYPHRIEGMVERGLAGCTPEESGWIDQVLLRRGDPGDVLLEQVARRASSVLALGWHGALGTGRALVLKRLLEQAECPLLLVREIEESSARLKVGEDIDE